MQESVRDPWATAEQEFPRDGEPAEQLRFLLNYAVLAPSVRNTQPWRFKVSGNEAALYADRSRRLPMLDPSGRQLVLSCGAALFHLRVAIRHFGHEAVVETFPSLDDVDLLARVHLGDPIEPTLADHRLFEAIRLRHTHRAPFEDTPVPSAELQALKRFVEQDGAQLFVVRSRGQRAAIANLVAEGTEAQAEDPDVRREIAAWIKPNRSQRRDGIPGRALGYNNLGSFIRPHLLSWLDNGPEEASANRQLVMEAPALLVLTSERDNAVEWLQAGQALDHLLLQAADYGLYASFINQPTEVPRLRERLRHLLGTTSCPHAVLRMGYGAPEQTAPRHAVRDVLDPSVDASAAE